jgi:ribose transport system substrate-binding protein
MRNIRVFTRKQSVHSAGRLARLTSIVAVVVLAAGACSSNSSDSSTSSDSAGASSEGATTAMASVAAYTGKPSAFPVTDPLTSRLPAGKKFVFLQCSTPFCALAGTSLQAAVEAIGGEFIKVNAGATASSSQAAVSSVAAMKPDAVFVTVDPALYGDGLKKLSDAGAKVVSISIVKDVKPYGVTFNYIGNAEIENDGRLLADWVIAKKGPKADVVFYGLPTFDFSKPMQAAFEGEMKENCPSCKVRTVSVDASTIGTTSARTVVADLQAHPSTNVAVFSSMQMAAGLPAALRAAGKSVLTVGRGPTPGNLADIASGGLTAGLAIDAPVSTWTAVDSAARLLLGGQPTADEQAGTLDKQFLSKEDITFDPTRGWAGYPDFVQRFKTLWHVG